MNILTRIKDKLQRNGEIYARAWRQGRIAGIGLTWILWKSHTKFLLRKDVTKDKQAEHAYLNRFWKKFANVVSKYKDKPIYDNRTSTKEQEPNIWLYWNDKSKMPDMVKSCIERIHKNANGNRVVIVTEDTVKDYLTLDDVVWEKYNAGKISRTHFCDIVRIALLYKYGGVWLDCTLLLTQPLPKEVTEADFFTNRLETGDTQNVCRGRWSTFMLACHPGNLMMRATLDVFIEYWKRYDDIVSYVWMDYIFYLLYNEIPSVRQMIDAVPYNNPDIWIQQLNIGKPCTQDQFEALLCDKSRFMWKFSYKASVTAPIRDEHGCITLKGRICGEQD